METFDIEQLVQTILADLKPNSEPEKLAAVPEKKVVDNAVFIGSNVISLAEIKEKTGGAKKLYINPKAIITPSAKDEIRRRKIEIAVRLSHSTENKQHLEKVYFVTPECQLSASLKKTGVFNSKSGIGEALRSALSAPNEPYNILLTDKPATAVYEASRTAALRPVIGFNAEQTAEDIIELNANLVILSPKRLGESKLREILRSL